MQIANPKTVYIVMSYCECGDLSDVLRATKVPHVCCVDDGVVSIARSGFVFCR
jgi:hypothetical protein